MATRRLPFARFRSVTVIVLALVTACGRGDDGSVGASVGAVSQRASDHGHRFDHCEDLRGASAAHRQDCESAALARAQERALRQALEASSHAPPPDSSFVATRVASLNAVLVTLGTAEERTSARSDAYAAAVTALTHLPEIDSATIRATEMALRVQLLATDEARRDLGAVRLAAVVAGAVYAPTSGDVALAVQLEPMIAARAAEASTRLALDPDMALPSSRGPSVRLGHHLVEQPGHP